MAWFDATQVEPNTGGASAPIGRYPVTIRASRVAPSAKNPNSGRLIFDCEILDGEHKGVHFDYGLNLWNEDKQAAEIAGKQLSSICHVTGVYVLNAKPEGVELFGKPFIVVVDKQKDDDKYTEVKQVQDVQGNPPVRGQAPQRQASPHSPGPGGPANGAAPAWAGGGQTQQQPAQEQAAPSWAGGGQQAAPATDKPTWAQQPASDRPSWSR